ncbi:PaaI family thioesterase [Aquabacterium sp.]|uniref:PaaI family thioesterase n=1 Tax=Aquabacterium sp. TaxID=1872578 RepID=UPI002486F5B8|nr:PaaI family thioesterase [Aquabacterium sp.]MDI1258072.1 PaaI family thioesterase [Aquabacterium sp.]
MSLFNDTDRLQWVHAFIAGIPYARASNMHVTEVSQNHATLAMPACGDWTGDAERQLTHPGVLTVLADTACGVAVGTALDVMEPFATLDLRMDYLRPAVADRELICHAECHRLSRSVAFVRGEIRQPGQDEVLATVQATFMRATASARRDPLAAPKAARASAEVKGEAIPLRPTVTPALAPGVSPYVDYLSVHQSIDHGDDAPLFRLPFKPDLIGNPVLPALHGGVLAGFAETAMVLHLVSTMGLSDGTPPRGVDFSIDYLRSARPVDTFAQATTIRQGSRVALVQVTVWQDDQHKPVATARGHFLLPRDPA